MLVNIVMTPHLVHTDSSFLKRSGLPAGAFGQPGPGPAQQGVSQPAQGSSGFRGALTVAAAALAHAWDKNR